MKKYILLLFVLLVACESNSANQNSQELQLTIEEIQQHLEEKNQEIVNLSTEVERLDKLTDVNEKLGNRFKLLQQDFEIKNQKIMKLSAEVERLNKMTDDNEELENRLNLLEEENHILKTVLENLREKNGNQKTEKTFDAHLLNIGDRIGGFKVEDILLTGNELEIVEFNGFFIMTGEIWMNMVGGSQYGLVCTKEEIIANLPVSEKWNLDKHNDDYRDFFRLLSDEKVIEQLGEERVNEMSKSFKIHREEIGYKITAVFNKFTYQSQPNTDTSSSFDLVTILSIEDI